MNKFVISLFFSFIIQFVATASPVDTYEFTNDVDRIRYQDLVKELRCPKCQNQKPC